MLEQPLRGVEARSDRISQSVRGQIIALCTAAMVLGSGCEAIPEEDAITIGERYVSDVDFRRAALEESLVRRDNHYARLRLDQYGRSSSGWDQLAEFNPPVRPVLTADFDRFVDDPNRASRADEGQLRPVWDPDETEWSESDLVDLGRRAFELYPVQFDSEVGRLLASSALADRFGLWTDDRGRVGGLVRVRVADGSERVAVTCATCHATVDASRALQPGLPNARFDRGGISYRAAIESGVDPERAQAYLEWNVGTLDVTPDGISNPTAIPDLRPIRFSAYLHWAATLENRLEALAVRLETLIITSHQESVRPPREIAFALALYLWRMADAGHGAEEDGRGARDFRQQCGGCHGADGTARGRIDLHTVGTDPRVGRSPARGTGFYRVPSLWGVGERTLLLHDGSIGSLTELLDPSREGGHRYGLALGADERADLVRYVRTIGSVR